jgi:heme exporter protein C
MGTSQLAPSPAAVQTDSSTQSESRNRFLKWLTVLAVLGFIASLYAGLIYAGTDTMQGNVQRLFYPHLGTLMGAALSYASAFIGGIAYLRTRNLSWDTLALSAVEVGLAFTVIALATGMVWARPTWNTWWTWDPRMTSAAIMALTYGAYLMLRNGIENPRYRRNFASVYSILAISTVILTFTITRIRPDSIHPTVIGPSASNAQGSFGMTTSMGVALGISVVVWCFLIMPALIGWRVHLEHMLGQKSDA